MIKKIGWGVLVMFLVVALYFHELIGYGISQGKGQFKVLWHAQPIAEVLAYQDTPDSIKYKLELINDIRNFAFDSLGLTRSENYTTYYDQHGKNILWVVTACEPYMFKPKEWSFPIIGSFTYKGFFDINQAKALAKELSNAGFDVEMSSVTGWSTLGWFKDPVLSNMLEGTNGSMANTITHELTHGTLFIPDSMTFNENLASFVGTKGALNFLKIKYGENAQEVIDYSYRISDRDRFTKYMVLGASQLDSIYKVVENKSLEERKQIKENFITLFNDNIDTVSFINPERYQQLFATRNINNAGFISFLKYRERQYEFDTQLANEFDGDLRKFITYWKNRYPM